MPRGGENCGWALMAHVCQCAVRATRSFCRWMGSWKHVSWSPARVLAMQIAFTALGVVAAVGVGLVLFNISLQSQMQEFKLKCTNRQEIVKAELANNLNTSFMILGLLANEPDLKQSTWLYFTNKTFFLRPNSPRIAWLKRVKHDERAAFEKKVNASILQIDENLTVTRRVEAPEYAPIVLASFETAQFLMMDFTTFPVVNRSVSNARDFGTMAMSPPDNSVGGVWRVGNYLPYYGDAKPSTVAERRETIQGWIGVSLEVEKVFAAVLRRYQDDVSMDVAVIFTTKDRQDWLPSYNCSFDRPVCEMPVYDPAQKVGHSSTASIPWTYGLQSFELRCFARHSIKIHALKNVIGWPLLLLTVVVLCTVIVWLIIRRMQAVQKHVSDVEKMNADLRAAKLAAESADSAKSRFLATVSHEIRTPMNGVIGMTNLLMGTELTSQQLEYVKIAQASGNALVSLINEVLDLSKIEAGKMELESVAFDLRVELDDVLCLFEDKVHNKQLEVLALVHDAVPKIVFGDNGRFRQVLINLVGNAMKFTKEGSIMVCVRVVDPHSSSSLSSVDSRDGDDKMSTMSLTKVTEHPEDSLESHSFDWYVGQNNVKWCGYDERECNGACRNYVAPRLSMQRVSFSDKETVRRWRNWTPRAPTKCEGFAGGELKPSDQGTLKLIVSVEDTGIGIPSHLQHRLFQPFHQADSSTSREFGGTGIGLSISQKLVELMNGKLTVSSTPGKGSVFEFTLKVESKGAERLEQSKAEWSDFGEEKLKGTRVVLVDEHPVRQEVVASYLRRLGVEVEGADDKRTALELLHKQDIAPFQGVILDLQGMQFDMALELVKFLRRSPKLQKIAVLAVSTPLSAEKMKEVLEAGVTQTVFKPIRRTTLASGLLQALGIKLHAPSRNVNTNSKMLADKRMLVVDDNLVNRKVCAALLNRLGATVECVCGGEEAMNSVRNKAPDMQFDLIFMDIQMPEMDGYEATRRIRQWEIESCIICRHARRRSRSRSGDLESGSFGCRVQDEQITQIKKCPHNRIPVVALTADVMNGTQDLCLSAGMDDYIPKPLDQRLLHKLLERFLNNELLGGSKRWNHT
ncbi:arabidopsis histidine kinase 2/3/4 (cytokinin receptor) [Marchantia polymorpha subsp. ruderalis]|uniref:histidine kinase n=2 Tax=Marchantia polymorpha TaxID=3197 RepID=A0AAF6BM05_MARPO|nr:hypothetical protein MARPO_0104s0036 [Marchantia polymorpha]BBN13039.1 hypothetical protein Mp_6g00310 [Marchantia polymorpha subsp. ruderalis]|eukprot:PTQ32007.1 hypothetical protein MARPO_0104s0036 [Marchantia polymorpha]